VNLDRRSCLAIAAACLAMLLAIPPLAAARDAYVTGTNESSSPPVPPPLAGPYVARVDLNSQATQEEVGMPEGGEGAPPDIAITPDGKTAYVVNGASEKLVPINIATTPVAAETAIPLNTPFAIAITPDGTRAYVTELFGNDIAEVNLASRTVTGSIPVGNSPNAIAITPDGSRAYVVNQADNDVSVVDLTTKTVIATIPVGESPDAIAITPNGSRAYVANSSSANVSVIDVTTNTVVATIPTSGLSQSIAITPNGSRAYEVNLFAEAIPIDTAANTAAAAIPVPGFLQDVSIAPDGSHAYVTGESPDGLTPINVASNTPGARLEIVKRPGAIAIVPNQPPHAAFTASPAPAKAGEAVGFNASATSDPDSNLPIGRYEWNFGDGTTVASGGAKPQHTYAQPGTYQVTLTATDGEGCSTQIVFTGQTAYCNGSGVARVTHPVVVAGLNVCSGTKASASTFIPKRRPGNVVPGVRVKISTAVPSKVTVTATALYWQSGKQASAQLGKITATIKHWRQVRFAIPPELRTALPLGAPLRVQVRIESEPTGGPPCEAAVATRVLKVHVVKVFPNRVQFERSR